MNESNENIKVDNNEIRKTKDYDEMREKKKPVDKYGRYEPVIKNEEIKAIVEQQLKHDRSIRPIKLSHIVNDVFLNNTINPLNGKYVRKIWAHKRTKLGRWKRDLIWEFFRDRKRKSVAETLRRTLYKNVPNVTVIYFGDYTKYNFNMTKEIADYLKTVKYYRHEFNCIHPLNGRKIKQLYFFKTFKSGRTKRYILWDYIRHGEVMPVKMAMIKTYHNNIRSISILYQDNQEEEFTITDEIAIILIGEKRLKRIMYKKARKLKKKLQSNDKDNIKEKENKNEEIKRDYQENNQRGDQENDQKDQKNDQKNDQNDNSKQDPIQQKELIKEEKIKFKKIKKIKNNRNKKKLPYKRPYHQYTNEQLGLKPGEPRPEVKNIKRTRELIRAPFRNPYKDPNVQKEKLILFDKVYNKLNNKKFDKENL